jgi:hypothetical protein
MEKANNPRSAIRPRLCDQMIFEGNDQDFHSKIFIPPPIKSIQFLIPRACPMYSGSVLTRELNIHAQSQLSTTQSIISAKNRPNVTGPKLPLPIQ